MYNRRVRYGRFESWLFPRGPEFNDRQEVLPVSDDHPSFHSHRRANRTELLHHGERRSCQ